MLVKLTPANLPIETKNEFAIKVKKNSKCSLRHAVSACVYRMRFQSQLGQTKVDFNNQGKNAPQCLAFWLEIFLFKIEIVSGKKLKQRVATSLKCFVFFRECV